MSLHVHIAAFAHAQPLDVADGLLGWADVQVGPLVVHGVAVRRTRGGAITLSWPRRDDRRSGRRSVVRPLDDDARREIERRVVAELRRRRIAS